MFLKFLFATFLLTLASIGANADQYDDKLIFNVFKADKSPSFSWKLGTNLTSQGCDKNGNFTFVLHGFQNSVSIWSKPLIDRFLQHRNNCAVYVNWGAWSEDLDYLKITNTHEPLIAKALLRRFLSLESEGVLPKSFFVYAHSVGARIAIDTGIAFGGRIPFMDLADPAGPGFYDVEKTKDSKKAAINVQIIHTSSDFGTTTSLGHQDWFMGVCGFYQFGEQMLQYILCKSGFCPVTDNATLSHMMANVLYIAAFDNNFIVDDCIPCYNITKSKDLPPGFKMGFLETRRNPTIRANIAVPTSLKYPYTGYDPLFAGLCQLNIPGLEPVIDEAATILLLTIAYVKSALYSVLALLLSLFARVFNTLSAPGGFVGLP